MKNPPVFSIVIPTYNRVLFLKRALDSVFNQTYENYEVIVVDDGSTDRTLSMLSEISDPRLKIIHVGNNSGTSNARNMGIQTAKGKYISLLDSDDEFLPDFLEKTLKTLDGTEPEVGFCWSGIHAIQIISDQFLWKKHITESIWNPSFRSRAEATRYSLSCDPPWGTGHGVTFKKGVLAEVGWFDTTIRARVDIDLLIRLVGRYNFVVIPEILVTIHKDAHMRIEYELFNRAMAYEIMYRKYANIIKQYPDSIRFFSSFIVKCYCDAGEKKRALMWLAKQWQLIPSNLFIIKLILKVLLPIRIEKKGY